MTAKQTTASASVALALVGVAGVAGIAHADPADPNTPTTAPSASGATGKFQVGVGYDTVDRWFATAQVSQANLFGSGNTLSLVSGLSDLHQMFRLDYVQPHAFDSDGVTLDTQLYDDRRALPGLTRDMVGGTVTASTQLSQHVRAYLGYRLERVTGEVTGDDTVDPLARGTPGGPAVPAGDDWISAIRAGLEYDTRNSRVLPRRGDDLGVSVEYADPLLGSDLQLATLSAWAGTHRPLGPVTLHLEGSLTTLASGSVIPLADRLWLIGPYDVRGFLPGSITPLDAAGTPIGGTLELTGRASLELPLGRTGVSLEGFYDYARLADMSRPASLGGVAVATGMSVGTGIVWRSPLGPLRVDVALPLVHGALPTLVFGIGTGF
jgi:outer membrane protein insertion porin family|nr:BamA/TamA family outer membrane protein [Kofleriaceae bacterium]